MIADVWFGSYQLSLWKLDSDIHNEDLSFIVAKTFFSYAVQI